ncbi:DUF3192 domain-containing protein [Shewanella sp. Isolate11]|uniref:DUF3192 domain-containing protein n=1 Tax=Shewanella sp. Isolate11 TaxID=2908530 RepID=UPI001EFD87F5|nr:DUF3192 domain-containing protein [Shewanella sp. Isolate11]MCG9696128.1 DUF3192 domain-containing protein [Shewanella sp. Isolate11]
MLVIIDKQEVKVKTKLLSLVLFGAASVALSGCVLNIGDGEGNWDKGDSWERVQDQNRANLAKLSLGMSRDQVMTLMGTADFNEAYLKQDKQVFVLYYRTQRVKGDGTTTKEECTPIVLADNAVVGWGEKAYHSM